MSFSPTGIQGDDDSIQQESDGIEQESNDKGLVDQDPSSGMNMGDIQQELGEIEQEINDEGLVDQDPSDDDEDEEYDDWGLPANYRSLELEGALDGQPVWQLVKRPWKPTDEQKSESQLAADKRKEKLRKERAEEDDEEEPGTTEVEEKFHYYWRLSAPQSYEGAGAVGKRWRAVRFVAGTVTLNELNQAELHWIPDARWQKICGKPAVKNVPVYDKNFTLINDTFGDVKIEELDGRTSTIQWKVLHDLITNVWPADVKLQKEAQQAATDDDLIPYNEKPENHINTGQVQEDTKVKLVFKYDDDTFVDSRGSFQACPTSETKGSNLAHRLYIKLRSAHVKLLDTSGGLVDPGRDDVFILKTKMEKLANLQGEDDPLLATLEATDEAQQWKSDGRLQGLQEEQSNVLVDHRDVGNTTSPVHGESNEPKKQCSRQDVSFWVRNAHGFAFKFTTKVRHAESWAKTRKEAIRSIESDQGWCRYIDPPIDLYIVPVSHDASMQEHVYEAMSLLDMPSDSIKVSPSLQKKEPTLLAKLRSRNRAKPECETTKIHLLSREDIRSRNKPLIKLAKSPFNHYETWITKIDWESYLKARPDRSVPVHPKDKEVILKTKKVWESKGKEAQGAKERAMTEEGKRKTRQSKKKGKKGAKNGGNIKENKNQVELENQDDEAVDKPAKDSLQIRVSSSKLHNAAGTRGSATTQAAVMGCSATVPCNFVFPSPKIAKSFNWEGHDVRTPADDPWPGTTHKPAEWLHRCAYSWGGLEGDDLKSSQVPENLIFGTGECNSVMTRYEKAWQELVRREGDRLAASNSRRKTALSLANPGIGTLWASINRKTYRAQFGIPVKVEGTDLVDQDATPQPTTEEEQKKNFPSWLCYALDYELTLDEKAEPLNMKAFKTVFYPWQRGFFTKFEQILDEVILDRAYSNYEAPAGISEGGRISRKVKMKEEQKKNQLKRNTGESEDQSEEELDNQDNSVNNIRRPKELARGFDNKKNVIMKLSQSKPKRGSKKNTTHQDGSPDDTMDESITHFSFLAALPEPKPDPKIFSAAAMTRIDDGGVEPYPESSVMSDVAEPKTEVTVGDGCPIPTTVDFPVNGNSTYAGASAQTSQDADAMEPPSRLCAIWDEVHAPGPTLIDGLVLTDAAIVMGDTSTAEHKSGLHSYAVASPVGGQLDTSGDVAHFVPPDAELVEATNQGISAHAYDVGARPAEDSSSEQPGEGAIETQTKLRDTNATEIFDLPVVDALQEPVYSMSYMMPAKKEPFHSTRLPDLEPEFHMAKIEAIPESMRRTPQQGSAGDDKQSPAPPVPSKFVVKSAFKLFGLHTSTLSSLQAPRSANQLLVPHQNYHIKLPSTLSLGTLLPSLANSQLDAIALNDTTFTYKSNGRRAGLSLHTTITLSGFLQPVNTLLRDVLGQDRPRIDVSGRLSTTPLPDCLTRAPQPLAFVLTGELPEVSVDLFGLLTITHIGIEVSGTRKSSAGGYDLGYGFFGKGRISATTTVGWCIRKLGEHWSISIYTESTSWTNVAGIDGVNLKNVFLEASWLGTKIATARLSIRATFSIKEQATLMLRGQFAKDDFEVAGYLAECNLTTLKQLYNQSFNANIDVNTEHKIAISSMVLIVSKCSGVTLYGAVSVDDHEAAEAFIHIGAGAIEFEGSLTGSLSVGPVKIEQPSLALAIYTSSHSHGSGFMVKFAGRVSISDKHTVEVLVYLDKSKGNSLDYTVYGAYEGELCLHDLLSVLGETDLLRDVKMRRIAVCVSSVDRPDVEIAGKPPSYVIGRGLAVYAEVSLPVVSKVLSVDESKSFVVCASYRPPADGGDLKAEISIRIPDQNAFQIDRFSVGNIALAVQIIGNLPSIKISGDLTFPVEDDKRLTMALGLSAGIYEARGEAELITDWVNPLNLSKAVTIKNFKAGLGILYAGGTPSSVTLGGAVVVGSVSGSVLIHTGTDPKQQLLDIKLRNLDVAALLKAVGSLIDVDLKMPGGNDAFFVRKLDLYLSTGCEVMGEYHPRGIRLDVDMTLFGKRARLFAEIQKGHVVIKGSVQKFKLGPLEVCAASNPDNDPSVDIELSSFTQRIKIDGKVILGQDNWVILLVDIDTSKGTFYGYFELVIGDTLMIKVEVKLDGGLPPAKQDRVDQIEDAKNDKAQKPPPPLSQPQPLPPTKPTIDGGLLQGKTFTVHAKVEQAIVDYLVKLANDHLGGERDPAELGKLQDAFNTAKAELREAEGRYKTVKGESDSTIAKVTAGLDTKAAEIRSQIAAKQKHMDAEVARLQEEERNLVLQSAQDERDLNEKEAREAAEADSVAYKANIELEAWRGRVQALRVADMAEQTAAAVLEATEMELANAQAAVMRHERSRPDDNGTDPTYEPWRWEHGELKSVAATLDIKVAEAAGAVKAAKDGIAALRMGTVEDAEAKLEELASAASEADTAATARRAAIAGNMETGRAMAKKKRENVQKRRADLVTHSNKIIEDLRAQGTAFDRERADRVAAAQAKHDPRKTDAGKAYEKSLQKCRAADVKLRAYRQLKDSISGAGEVLLTPLRFAVNVLGKGLKQLLNVKSIVLDGTLRDTSGKVKAAVCCTVGGYDWNWTLEIDLGDIVVFFTKLWEEIKSVISSVADKLIDLAKKGIEAVKEFCKTIGSEVRKIADDAQRNVDQFMKHLAEAENQVRDFLDDIDKTALQPFRRAGEQFLRELDQGLQLVNTELDKAAADVERDLNRIGAQIGAQIGDATLGVIMDVDRAFGGFLPSGLRNVVGVAVASRRPDPEELGRMVQKLGTKMRELSEEEQRVQDLIRQNRETRQKGRERDQVESELRIRLREIELGGVELRLEKDRLWIMADRPADGERRMSDLSQRIMQFHKLRLRLLIRQSKKKNRPLEGDMKRAVIENEIEEIRQRLISGKREIEAMQMRREEPEKIMKHMKYLERLMKTMNKKREQLK